MVNLGNWVTLEICQKVNKFNLKNLKIPSCAFWNGNSIFENAEFLSLFLLFRIINLLQHHLSTISSPILLPSSNCAQCATRVLRVLFTRLLNSILFDQTLVKR